MKKYINNQIGFSGLEIIIVIVILGAIGAVSYLAVDQASKHTVSREVLATVTPKPSVKSTVSPVPKSESLALSQLGIEIVNIPTSLSDINFAVTSSSGYVSMGLSTATLTDLDSGCSPNEDSVGDGYLTREVGTYTSSTFNDAASSGSFVKQFNGFWIAYNSPQSACSENNSTEQLHRTQTATLKNLVTNPANLLQLN